MSMQEFYRWAYDRSDERDPKYSTNSHAIFKAVTGSMMFTAASFAARHVVFEEPCGILRPEAELFGYFLLGYLAVLVVGRYYDLGCVSIYEVVWACNQALLVGSIALIIRDSHLVRASMVVVSLDQLLWYVDLTGFVLLRKFPVGVAKYIVWDRTTKIRLATTFHHVFFIPLLMWLCSPSASVCGLSFKTYLLSCVMALTLAFVGRITTPKQVVVRNKAWKEKAKNPEGVLEFVPFYMNLNISWEMWKDVKIKPLQRAYEVAPQNIIPVILSMYWNAGSLIGFTVLYLIESLYSS